MAARLRQQEQEQENEKGTGMGMRKVRLGRDGPVVCQLGFGVMGLSCTSLCSFSCLLLFFCLSFFWQVFSGFAIFAIFGFGFSCPLSFLLILIFWGVAGGVWLFSSLLFSSFLFWLWLWLWLRVRCFTNVLSESAFGFV